MQNMSEQTNKHKLLFSSCEHGLASWQNWQESGQEFEDTETLKYEDMTLPRQRPCIFYRVLKISLNQLELRNLPKFRLDAICPQGESIERVKSVD